MKVRYDDQIFASQVRGGISRYFVEMIQAFVADPELGVQPELGWRWTRNAHALDAGLGKALRPPFGRRSIRLANRVISLRTPRPDVIHHTYYESRDVRRPADRPAVVTVYDMIPELLPEFFAHGNPHLAKLEYVRRASLVVCISESTKRDLLRLMGPIDAPIVVTALGVGSEFRPGLRPMDEFPDRYVAFLGNRGGYKDFRVALEGFAQVHPRHPDLVLVAIGGGPLDVEESSLIRRWLPSASVMQIGVADPELPAALGGATAFMFPSRYEGFGLPTLESMACGTPVILAESSSHPEVGGDAALYFPPGDGTGLAGQLSRVLEDEGLRSTLSKRGIDRAAGFTWHRTASETAAAYRIALESDYSPGSMAGKPTTVTRPTRRSGPNEFTATAIPLVTIITPTLNQASFIEATLRSVAEQEYPLIEHIVVDGGSTDGTLGILERWGGRWISEPDQGQADAINKGVAMASGSICTWLNSDDVYLSGTVISTVVERFKAGAQAISGQGRYVDASGDLLGPTAFEPERMTEDWLRSIDYILQPATFYTTALARRLRLDPTLRWAFDWDFFARLAMVTTIEPLPQEIAGYRLQPAAKTLTGGLARQRDLLRVLSRFRRRRSLDYVLFAAVVRSREIVWSLPWPIGSIGWWILWRTFRVAYRLTGRADRLPT